MRQYNLIFDNRFAFGSPEHFYHYLLGYLLPALDQIVNFEFQDKGVQKKFLFRSCGPVMDEITREIANIFNIDYRIYDASVNEVIGGALNINVARWDLDLALYNKKTLISFFFDRYKYLKWTWMLQHLSKSKTDFINSLYHVRELVLDTISSLLFTPEIIDYSGKFLLLERSPEPEYYKKGGKAEIPTYGTGRRYLSHIHEARDYLLDRGIRAKLFEPGAYTLAEQIRVFHNCKGIIGVAGAEFANVIWMKPGSKVIRIIPAFKERMPTITPNLSNILKLDLVDITSPEQKVVELRPESFEAYLK